MKRALFFTIFGYLSGSILYADVFGVLFGKKAFYAQSPDQNPGTANAFKYGGFWCGALTLLCDLFKGLLPVLFYLRAAPLHNNWGLLIVLAAPVLGHIFPIFRKFRGGKGIATTFGCLLGLIPYILPVAMFAAVFLFLSLGLRITPAFYRTIIAYWTSAGGMALLGAPPAILVGFLTITAAVCLRLHLSKEEKERFGVKVLWMR